MPGTILQTLPKFSDGLLLFESFESFNFMQDQGWALSNGVPTTSNAAAKEGLRSLIMDLTFPQIQKTTTSYKSAAGYFLDDASVVTGGLTPFMIFQTAGGNRHGIGVDLAVSTTHYTKMVGGVRSATGVARTSAWHRISIDAAGGVNFDLKMDGTTVSSPELASVSFTKIQVGTEDYSGTIAFGYFDWIQITSTASVSFSGLQAGQVATLYTAAGSSIGTAAVSGSTATISIPTVDSPFQAFVLITRTNGTTPYYRSPVQSFSLGDTYTLSVYSFGRKPSAFAPVPVAERQDKRSISGKNQTTFFYGLKHLSIGFTDLTEIQKNELERWWSTAQTGDTFSVALDSASIYLSSLSADITGPGVSTFTPASAAGITKGSVLSFRNTSGSYQDTKTVTGVSAGVVTVDTPFTFKFLAGDQVRSLYYWPFVLTMDKTLNITLGNLKQKRWNASITFEEQL